jgi:hypothetical protein
MRSRRCLGVAKTITEHMNRGRDYVEVKKVYSINILYFDLGEGADYLYYGQTTLTGVHTPVFCTFKAKSATQRCLTPL